MDYDTSVSQSTRAYCFGLSYLTDDFCFSLWIIHFFFASDDSAQEY